MMVKVKVPGDKRYLVIAAVLMSLGICGLSFGIWAASSQAEPVSELSTVRPVVPKGETAESLANWQELTPPKGGDAFYVFTDSIGSVSVNVSQQAVPSRFKNNLESEVAQLARSYNATSKVRAGDTDVYIGASAKGPQSVIFTRNDLLILIKSWSTISNDDWVDYINSLQ